MVQVDIEKELKKLSEESQKKNKIKACLFNLIVYTKDEVRGDFLRSLVKSIVQKLPCRLFSINCLSNKGGSEEIEVNQYTSSTQENVCDHISIRCPETDLKKIPYLITPHFVPDLPIYIIWGDDPSSNAFLLNDLKKYASRLIFDLESVFVFKNYCETIIGFLNDNQDVIDIPWAILASWREIFVKVFDTKEKLNKLKNASTIRIHFNATESSISKRTSTFALYLTAWLASSFGWVLNSVSCKKNVTTIDYQDRKIELIPEEIKTLLNGWIVSIEVCRDSFELFQMVFKKNPDRVLVHESTEDRCLLPHSLPFMDMTKGFNFISELFYHQAHESYKKTMLELNKLSEKENSICEI